MGPRSSRVATVYIQTTTTVDRRPGEGCESLMNARDARRVVVGGYREAYVQQARLLAKMIRRRKYDSGLGLRVPSNCLAWSEIRTNIPSWLPIFASCRSTLINSSDDVARVSHKCLFTLAWSKLYLFGNADSIRMSFLCEFDIFKFIYCLNKKENFNLNYL